MTTSDEISGLLNRAERGDREAADRLFRLTEKELRAIAARRKRPFADWATESTTSLVDNAFCALVGKHVTVWPPDSRGKFFAYASVKIHDLLVDAARAQAAQKRGGNAHRVDMDECRPEITSRNAERDLALMLDLKAALKKLDKSAADVAKVFRLRYFLGCTFDEIAELLATSATRAKTLFHKSQRIMRRQLRDYRDED